MDEIDDEIRAEAMITLALARGSFGAAQAVGSVPIRSGDKALQKRMLGAFCNGNVATIHEGQDSQGIVEAHIGGDVASYDANSLYIYFGRIDGEEDGESVVGARIRIDEDLLGRLARGCC